MTYRYGNDYLISLFNETAGAGSYGAYPGDYSVRDGLLPDALEMTPLVRTIDTGYKTGTLEPRIQSLVAGRKDAKVTLRGTLSDSHEVLLKALFNDTASPYALSSSHEPVSWEIHQHFLADDEGHVAKGCVLESLVIEGEGNGPIRYEATFRAKSFESEVALDTGAYAACTSPTVPTPKPFLFDDVTSVSFLGGDFTSLVRFRISLNNQFTTDDALWTNARVKQRELVTGFSGQIEFAALYQDSLGWYEDQLVTGELADGAMSLRLTDGTSHWDIAAHGRIMEIKPADPDRHVFLFGATVSLSGDGVRSAISVTVS